MIPKEITASRGSLEAFSKKNAACSPFGNKTSLCKVLGKYDLIVDSDDLAISYHLMKSGYWESWVTLAIARYLRPGMFCLDVGANHGYYTALMADGVGESGKVLACEPYDDVRNRCLSESINIWALPQVSLSPCAVSDREGAAYLYTDSSNIGGGSLFGSKESRTQSPCVATTIDKISEEWHRLDLVKIDVEGAEFQVWEGMRKSLERFPSVSVVVEVHAGSPYVKSFLNSVRDFGAASGRTIRRIDYNGDLIVADLDVEPSEAAYWTLWI